MPHFNPRRSGKTARFIGDSLPAEPVLDVESEPAAVEALEAIFVGIRGTDTYHTLAEVLVYLYAQAGLNLVVPLVPFGVENQAHADEGRYRDRSRVGGENRRALLEIGLSKEIVVLDRTQVAYRCPALSGQSDCVHQAALHRGLSTVLSGRESRQRQNNEYRE